MGITSIIAGVAICTGIVYVAYKRHKSSPEFTGTQEAEVETGQTHESGGAEPL